MAPPPHAPQLIWRLVEESLSEAAFLWLRLDGALDADDHALGDAERWVEGRLQGALDGVRVAGGAAIDSLLVDALQGADLGAVSAAAYVLAMLDDPKAGRTLENAVREVTAERVDALALGLGRACQSAKLHSLWSRLGGASARAQAVVLSALTFCGEVPRADWRVLLEASAAQLRRAAAAALTFLPSADLDQAMSFALESPDPAVQSSACIAGVSAGDSHAWRRCVKQVATGDPQSGPLLTLTAALGSQRDHACVFEALAVPELQRDALWALGFAGTRAAVEACLAQLRAGNHAPLAAAAVAAITGFKLARSKPSDESMDETDGDLAAQQPGATHLDVTPFEQWWASHGQRFDPAARYLDGQIATLASLRKALEHGPTRRRHAIALELTARSRGAFRLQTRGFCRLQRQQLSQLDSLDQRQLRHCAQVMGFQPLVET
jgi:uncharacterized protein (TIGR02270 family)